MLVECVSLPTYGYEKRRGPRGKLGDRVVTLEPYRKGGGIHRANLHGVPRENWQKHQDVQGGVTWGPRVESTVCRAECMANRAGNVVEIGLVTTTVGSP